MFQINWKLKSLLYKFFEKINNDRLLNFIQKYITKRSKIDIDNIKVTWLLHDEILKKYKVKKLVEFGAGKSLEQNIFFSLNNNIKIEQLLLDVYPIIDMQLVDDAYKKISKLLKKKTRIVEDLKIFNINYIAPFKKQNIKRNFFNIVTSTNTLEHLKKKEILDFLKFCKLILKKKGIISLIIDCSDHYSHTDRKISPLNFLKFSNKEWNSKYNSKYLFQNRLRIGDYIKIFKKNKFKILQIKKSSFGKPPDNINNKYKKNLDNFILWFHVVLQK